MGLKFDYPHEFERIWKSHPVGVKKLAFEAWKKQKFTAAENDELVLHLDRRHRDDRKWVEGKYVPHLSTFINQRRWEDDYVRVKRAGGAPKTGVPDEIWRRMGYANEQAYQRGERLH